jgi:phospholipid/cholesterol/gamma-HCH transport system substrate-binding protein
MNKDRRLEVKVGLFVVGAIVLGAIGVLLLGKSKHVFEKRVQLHATFADIAGLVQGAPVRLSGVNVGTVSQIMFVRADPRPQIRVDMEVTEASLGLIRTDSVAQISGQGLLGDKIIEVSVGSSTAGHIGAGGQIQTAEAVDLDKMLRHAADTIDDAKRVAERAADAVDQFADAKTIAEFRHSVVHLHALLHATDQGHGLAHAIFYDKRTADELTRLETNLSRLSENVDRGVQRINTVLASTDGDGKQIINNVSRAAKSVGKTADEIEASHVVANLERASGDLAQMTHYMKGGQGTLGALVMDPTVYEQLVQVLGGVGRSRILRALVRYAISRDDEKTAARVVDDKNVPDVKAPPKDQAPKDQAPKDQAVKRAHDSAKR